ncbi:MAG TPA: DUF4215 domain-containing protein [Minicystis sp.]|nr:DUF4215 domain-containing protein [Minicystis sp.]
MNIRKLAAPLASILAAAALVSGSFACGTTGTVDAPSDGSDGTGGSAPVDAARAPSSFGTAKQAAYVGHGPSADLGGKAGAELLVGGGGAPAAPTNDACPGEGHTINVGEQLTLTGSTVGANPDLQLTVASCWGGADTSGADVVYAVTFGGEGTLEYGLTPGSGLTGALYIETACGDGSSLQYCGLAETDQLLQTMAVHANQTLYFVVDGASGTAGDFTLQFNLIAPSCGDGVVNSATEQCDDGNLVAGDGCDASCNLESQGDASDTCPGQVLNIDMNGTIDMKGNVPAIGEMTTLPYHDDFTTCDGIVFGSPDDGQDQNGNDRVFQIVPSSSGTLFVQLRNLGAAGGGFDATLSAWANSCSPAPASANFDWATGLDPASGDYMGCSDHAYGVNAWSASDPTNIDTQESLTFQVTAGTPYFVVVDGYAGYSDGEFWLYASLTP